MSEHDPSAPGADPNADPDETFTPPELAAEATALYNRATGQDVTLRLIGSLAVQLVCPTWKHLAPQLERRPPGDIDFVGYAKQSSAIERLFTDAGYSLHPGVRHSQEFGVKRLIFVPAAGTPKVDVFLDDLIMAHTVNFAGRLAISAPTVSLVDLLLSKLQIHEMTRNDLVDLVILLAEHDIADDPSGQVIDARHFQQVMGSDWGFHYSAGLNLDHLDAALAGFDVLPPEVTERVREQIGRLKGLLADAPRSARWKLRARVGARVRWYEDVHEVE